MIQCSFVGLQFAFMVLHVLHHQSCTRWCLCMQEVLDLQLAVQMRDDHLAECQRQSELDQQQIDDLERQLLMQVLTSSVL